MEISHTPEHCEEHGEWCPYATEEWPTDDLGEAYWPDYDSESHNYEPECYCPDIVDSVLAFAVHDDDEWQRLGQYVRSI